MQIIQINVLSVWNTSRDMPQHWEIMNQVQITSLFLTGNSAFPEE